MLLDRFRFTATLLTGGGKDDRGNNLPSTALPITGCLLNPQRKSELDNLSESSETLAVLYFNHRLAIPKNARIITPFESSMPGTWSVDGDPVYWPLGTEVNLRKDS